MAKPDTAIPFSKFINITTSGVSDTFTFNRLNALAITTPLIPMPATVEAGSLEAVAKLYGAVSQEYSYAEEFFGYTSKNATKAQKLTFYNSYPEAQKAALVGAAISMLNDIKQQGSLNLTINGDEYNFDIDLENISSFSDAAEIINSNLQKEEEPAVPASLKGTAPALPFTAVTTIGPSEMIVQDNENEAVFTYTSSITFETSDNIDNIVTKLNTEELSSANLAWSNDDGVLKLSQINYSSASNTIPAKIFITETEIKTKLGLDSISTQAGSPEVPALNIGSCTYSTLTNGFIIQGAVASASQTIGFATGDMASVLKFSETDGGYVTSGSNGENLTEMLNHIGLINGDYVSIASINKIDTTDYEQIASWVNASGGRYAFIVISDDARLKSTNQIVYESLFGNDGFILIYGSNINMLAFMQAAIASVDFSVPGGMTNFNFIETPEFLDDSIGTSEELDGINANRANCCYIMGGYGQSQPLFGEGKIFGTNFNNIANYIGNSWIKAKMEIAGANLMISQGFIALRGGKGQSLILASLQEIIALAKASDIIVTVGTDGLLAAEKAKIVSVTGNANAVNLIESNGYYINVLPLTADDIANEQMRVQFIYTKNVPLNRLVVQNIVI
ncbi:MAG: DUF3383 family protein [Mucispirillum sp.]|nr:DUF3383 family protein [Mucispirillum sp.]